jgi:hypothetical protein
VSAGVVSGSAVDVAIVAVALDLGSVGVEKSETGSSGLAGEDLRTLSAQF